MDHSKCEVDRFLQAWKSSKDIEAFLDKKIELPNPDMIRTHLESLPEEEKLNAYDELSSVLSKLEEHKKEIEEKLKEVEEQMEQTKSAENMCISYEKAKGTTGKNKND